MPTEQPATIPRRMRDAGGEVGPGLASDGHLLHQFAAHGDEAAFAALVERHGPLVLGVCRRVLPHAHDVEDAFQATFMVLVRKAGTLRRPELLGNWLYGVAYRIARKLRASTETRRRHEARNLHPIFTQPDTRVEANDLRPVLDEELERLPEKYRLAVVLCYLEGKTNEEAARQLDWPTGTVKGRLARARDLLRNRLVRRGVALSAAALAFLRTGSLGATEVAGSLKEETVTKALGYAAGDRLATWSSAAALADAMLTSRPRSRWIATALAFLLTATMMSVASAAVASCYQSMFRSRMPSSSNCHHDKEDPSAKR